jgi:hypothetical protein
MLFGFLHAWIVWLPSVDEKSEPRFPGSDHHNRQLLFRPSHHTPAWEFIGTNIDR